jgi:hypothetical protein
MVEVLVKGQENKYKNPKCGGKKFLFLGFVSLFLGLLIIV